MSVEAASVQATDWKSIDKRHFVMAKALELLTDVGYQGLTMRGLAERCAMSLSNVQYYFRSKDELVGDIADRYFGECNAILLAHFEEFGPIEDRAGLERLVRIIMEHGRRMTDMCRVFRELWAVASRHEALAELLNDHYRRLSETLGRHFKLPSTTSQSRQRVIALFLTLSEGYSIIGPAQLVDHDDAISLFTDILLKATDTEMRDA
ncbi:MAG: TetR/AcrR family transcriptional regulator [Pseudomonadota bacterium]